MLVRKLRQHQLPEHRQEAQLIATSQTDAMHLKHVKRNTLVASRHEALCVERLWMLIRLYMQRAVQRMNASS